MKWRKTVGHDTNIKATSSQVWLFQILTITPLVVGYCVDIPPPKKKKKETAFWILPTEQEYGFTS